MPVGTITPFKNTTPDINKDTRFHSNISSRVQHLNSILAQISGSPQKVDYYSQILGENDEPKHLDTSMDATNQTYNLIVDLEIRITDPITVENTPDDTTGVSTVTGTANIFSWLKPAVGDVFLMRSIEGRASLYAVTRAKSKNYNNHSTFTIDFNLITLIDQDVQKYDNLKKKTIRQYYFDRKRLEAGQEPIIDLATANVRKELEALMQVHMIDHSRDFIDRSLDTLIIEGKDSKTIYDPYLVTFTRTIISTINSVAKLPYPFTVDKVDKRLVTILDVLLDRDNLKTDKMAMIPGLIPRMRLTTKSLDATLLYSPIDYIMALSSDNNPPDWSALGNAISGTPTVIPPIVTAPVTPTAPAPAPPTADTAIPIVVQPVTKKGIQVMVNGKYSMYDGSIHMDETQAAKKVAQYLDKDGLPLATVEAMYRDKSKDIIYIWTKDYEYHSGAYIDVEGLNIPHTHKEVLPNGDIKITHYDKDHNEIKHVVTTVDPNGNIVKMYDPTGALLSETKFKPNGEFDTQEVYSKVDGCDVITKRNEAGDIISSLKTCTDDTGKTLTLTSATGVLVTRKDLADTVLWTETTTALSDTLKESIRKNPVGDIIAKTITLTTGDDITKTVSDYTAGVLTKDTKTLTTKGVLIYTEVTDYNADGSKVITKEDVDSKVITKKIIDPTNKVTYTSIKSPYAVSPYTHKEIITDATGVTTVLITDPDPVLITNDDLNGTVTTKKADGEIIKVVKTVDLPDPEGNTITTTEYTAGVPTSISEVTKDTAGATIKTVNTTAPDTNSDNDKVIVTQEGNVTTTLSNDATGALDNTKVRTLKADGTVEELITKANGDKESIITKPDGSISKVTTPVPGDVDTVEDKDAAGLVTRIGTIKTLPDGTKETDLKRGDGKVLEKAVREADGTLKSGKVIEYNSDGTIKKDIELIPPVLTVIDSTAKTVTTTNPDGTILTEVTPTGSDITTSTLKDATGKVLEESSKKVEADGTSSTLTKLPDGSEVYKEYATDGTISLTKTMTLVGTKGSKKIVVEDANGIKYTIEYDRKSYASVELKAYDAAAVPLPVTKEMAAPFSILDEYTEKVKKKEERVKAGLEQPAELITVNPDIEIHKDDQLQLIGGVSNTGSM